jgi:hypothetical protein
MFGAVTPIPNTPSWRGAQMKAEGQLYFHLYENVISCAGHFQQLGR